MDASSMMDVSGPKKRKPLRSDPSQRVSPEKDDIIVSPDEISFEEQPLNCNREGSVNRSQEVYDQEYLIDSDVSYDCTDDDSEPIPEKERSVAEYSKETKSPGARRNSLNSSNRSHNAKMPTRHTPTLPPNQPTHGHFSDDMDPIPEKEKTPFTRRKTPTVLKASISPNPAPFQSDSRQNCETTTSGNNYFAFFLIIAILLSAFSWLTTKSKDGATCDHFHALEDRYATFDGSLWDSLNVSVHRAMAKREPGTFLFLHYGPTALLDRFINSVTYITAECFGGTEPITLDGKYFRRADIQQDYGVFLAQQKEALRQRGVLVVRNFQDVPARVAQVFHTICDTQEPLVDRAVIYLTLDMLKAAAVPNPSKHSAVEEAERLLRELWKDTLDPSVLQPLITRLTDNVYRVV